MVSAPEIGRNVVNVPEVEQDTIGAEIGFRDSTGRSPETGLDRHPNARRVALPRLGFAIAAQAPEPAVAHFREEFSGIEKLFEIRSGNVHFPFLSEIVASDHVENFVAHVFRDLFQSFDAFTNCGGIIAGLEIDFRARVDVAQQVPNPHFNRGIVGALVSGGSHLETPFPFR
jgi:hypothetical protein